MLLNVFQAPDYIEIPVTLACFENMQQSRQCIENSLGFENDRNVVVVYLMLYSHLRFIVREPLCELFSIANHEQWIHNPSEFFHHSRLIR